MYLYVNKTPLPDISTIEQIRKYLEYFSNPNIKPLKYGDTIIWFSQLVRFQFLQKTERNIEEETGYTDLVNILHQIMKPDEYGLCSAYYHQKSFAELSDKIVKVILNKNIQNKLSDINDEIDQIQNLNIEKKPKLKKDKNMIYYGTLVVAHIGGCLLLAGIVSGNFSPSIFWGNLFLYIPADIGLIIIYKGNIKNV